MYTLLGLLVLVVALLSIPLEVRFDTEWPAAERRRMELRWAFGAVRTELSAASNVQDNGARSVRPTAVTVPPRAGRQLSSIWRALRIPTFRQRVLRFVRELWGVLQKRDVRVHCRIGLETPADTGLIWSVLGPIASVLHTVRNCSISLTPDFCDECLQFSASGVFRVRPIQVVALLAGMLASPSIWRGVSIMR